jgi:flagellar biosynthesis/type III secretory pathway M-ring protein FliF/YscJ
MVAGVAAAAIMSVIIMNWTMITRRRRAEGEKLQLIGAHEVIEAEHLASRIEHNRRKPRDDWRGPSLRDELAEVVRDDPDVAVNVLRNWIASAG